MRQFAPALLDAFEFEGAPSSSSLLKAVALLRDGNSAGKRTLPTAAPIAFIRRGWRPFVLDADGKPDRRAWEVCVLSELRDRLRAGDIWVHGSRRYRNFEDCLFPKPTFAVLRAEGPLPIGVAEDAAEYLAMRRASLADAMADAAARAEAGTLHDATLDAGVLSITPLKAEEPPEAGPLAQAAYDLMPRIKITDLLLEVDRWTGFSECFAHQRSGRAPDDRSALLTTVLADGINLGLTRMSEACRDATLRQLAWIHDWHVREECYAAALARIIAPRLAARSDVGRRRHVQLGRSVLPRRRTRRGAGRHQRPSRQRAWRRVLHPHLRPVWAVPHQGHRGDCVGGAARARWSPPAPNGLADH
jgi:hypothetical protein